jgi:hypothetical protein
MRPELAIAGRAGARSETAARRSSFSIVPLVFILLIYCIKTLFPTPHLLAICGHFLASPVLTAARAGSVNDAILAIRANMVVDAVLI